MRAPISLCMIVKNESAQLEKCLNSIRPYVEEIVILDTGSSDNTPDIAKKYADKFDVYTGCNDDQGRIVSFADARQRSFSLATKKWCMWVDGDDEVRNAHLLYDLVNRYEDERNGSNALIMLPYEYAHDHNGKCICYHYRERIVTPGNAFNWHGAVHEVLIPKHPGSMHFRSSDVTIVHRRNMSGKPVESGRNLRILKSNYEKTGDADVRQLYYLGLEYGNVGDLENSITFHKKYVNLSGWDDEKFLSCLKIAEHYQAQGKYHDALDWGLKLLTIKENWFEGYFCIAKSYYFLANRNDSDSRRNWERCIHFCRQALSTPPTETILFVNPMDREHDIHRYLNYALNQVGDVKGAMESVKSGLSARPDDESLKMNEKIYKSFLLKSDISTNLNDLVDNGDIDSERRSRIQNILEGKNIFEKVDSDVNISNVFNIAGKQNDKDIVFFVGSGVEVWNPESIKNDGIGGSETAVVEMSKRLAALGNKVRVYSDCMNMEGVFDGVQWIDWRKYRDITCDVLISSRRPHAFDDEFNIKSKVNICWVHDVGCGSSLTHARTLRIDKFLCLSQWHKNYFLNNHKCVHPDQVIVTRNGIDVERFHQSVQRNSHKAVYSSSPDRGMEVAVRIWPEVRKQIPDAELHIFYGFKTWEVSARSVNDQAQLELISRLKNLILEHEKHGVVFHGRVDQKTLAQEFLSSGVWCYPTWFVETSCITAMEAQAAGLRVVTTPVAALNETVADRGVMVEGYWLDPDFQRRFAEATINELSRADSSEERARLQSYAFDHFSWDSLSKEWDLMLNDVIEEVKKNVLVPYIGAAV